MRIIVFMKADCEISDHPAAFDMKTPALCIRSYRRAFRWITCAAVYAWVAVSSHATLGPLASPLRPQSLAAATTPLSVTPPEAFYPVLGLLAAVACTCLLRRRRIAQLEAMAASER